MQAPPKSSYPSTSGAFQTAVVQRAPLPAKQPDVRNVVLHAPSSLPNGIVRIVASAGNQGQPVGSVELSRSMNGAMELSNLRVEPRYRLRGLGGRLVESAVQAARTGGATRVQLVAKSADPSLSAPSLVSMYQRHGFTLSGRIAGGSPILQRKLNESTPSTLVAPRFAKCEVGSRRQLPYPLVLQRKQGGSGVLPGTPPLQGVSLTARVVQRMQGNAQVPQVPIPELSRYDVLRVMATSNDPVAVARQWVNWNASPGERTSEIADLMRASERVVSLDGWAWPQVPPPQHQAAPPPLVAPQQQQVVGPPLAVPQQHQNPLTPVVPSAFDVMVAAQKHRDGWVKFCLESGQPPFPYDRVTHYGNTPTAADRIALGAREGQVVDHDPPLVERYYRGDPKTSEKAGFLMDQASRLRSAQDRTRMRLHSKEDSDLQSLTMRQYSIERMNQYNQHWSQFDRNWRATAYGGS